MANGIEDITIPPRYPQDEGGITDIVIEAGKNEAAIKAKEILDSVDQTGILSSQINPMDLRRLGEAYVSGNEDAANSILINEISELQEVMPNYAIQAVGNAIGVDIFNNPIGTTLAAATLTKRGLDQFAKGFDTLSGINIPGDNMVSSGIENALGLANQGVQYGVNQFGQIVDLGNTTYSNLLNKAIYNNPLYSGVRRATDALTDPLFNFQLGVPNLFARKKDEPDPPVQLTNDQVNQIVEDEINLGGGSVPPPIVVTDTQKNYESGVGQGTGQTGGPGGMGFAPPSPPPPPTVPNSGMTYGNVINRANGGLVSVSRYLKGR
jgi:hypothetical protein